MTQLITSKLHEAAGFIEIPDVNPSRVLRHGYRLRRRHQIISGGAALAASAVVAVGAGLITPGQDDGTGATTRNEAKKIPVGYGIRDTIYFSNDVTAKVPNTIHDMQYTAEGLLVRSNKNGGASDGSGPENLTLVAYDGAVTDLGILPEGVGPATDPNNSVFALARAAEGGFEAVIFDLPSGAELKAIPLPDLPLSYWEIPPLDLDDDVLYVGFRNSTVAFNWRTGEEVAADGLKGGLPEVNGGMALLANEVVEVGKGNPVLVLEKGYEGSVQLAPDGRSALVTSLNTKSRSWSVSASVYSFSDSKFVTLMKNGPIGTSFGWAPDGSIIRLTEKTLAICSAIGDSCREELLPASGGELAGPRNES
jgi:hypothetical protein